MAPGWHLAVSSSYQCTLNSQVFWPCFLLFSPAWCRPWLLTPFQLQTSSIFLPSIVLYTTQSVSTLFSVCYGHQSPSFSVSCLLHPSGVMIWRAQVTYTDSFPDAFAVHHYEAPIEGGKGLQEPVNTYFLKNKTLLISIRQALIN